MANRSNSVTWLIAINLLVACMFMLMPLPDFAEKVRPDFVTLTLMYWWLAHPEKVGVITGFCMGLVVDVMYGSLLGEHALGTVLVGWIFIKNYQSIRVLSLLQQALIVAAVLFGKQFLAYWIDSGRGQDTGSALLYFSPVLISALLWPWLFVLMRDLRRKVSKRF